MSDTRVLLSRISALRQRMEQAHGKPTAAEVAPPAESGERVRRLDQDRRRIETRPIKGTRPRGLGPMHDAALGRALAESEKDRAENVMIVDLLRNDLSRVCRPGMIRCTHLPPSG